MQAAALLLELTSFFLVTVDLYGRERIERMEASLNQKYLTASGGPSRWGVLHCFMDSGGEGPGCMILLATILWTVPLSLFFILRALDVAAWEGILLFVGLAFGGAIPGAFMTVLVVWTVMVIAEAASRGLLHVASRLAAQERLEGRLLLSGALLFVVSKVISSAQL